MTIPAGCTATLSFYLHIDTAETTTTIAYDTLTVKLGSTTLATYSNLNHNTGYAQKSFNVSSYAGQTVTLIFTGSRGQPEADLLRPRRHHPDRQLADSGA